MAARTVTATRPANGRSKYPPVSTSGNRVVNVAGVDVEVLSTDQHDGSERLTCISFPIPKERDLWAIVGLALNDGSRWSIGLDGWQLDEYPTITSAVEAVCNRITRARIIARTRHMRAVGDAERALRALKASQPPAPAGAIVPPPAVDPWRTMLGLPQVSS